MSFKKTNPMIGLSNVHLKPFNQTCKKVDQGPDGIMVQATFPTSHNNGPVFKRAFGGQI